MTRPPPTPGHPGDVLPIHAALPDIVRAMDAGSAAVVAAAPGAGKTTGVPPALLDRPWMAGRRIVMLEPRRLAARAAARRMAAMRGEEVGDTVGFRTRLESRVGPATRIEVVTEGILARQVQADPELAGVGAVLFDEFHERSLQADLALALCLDVQRALRPDLRLVVMSATLDTAAVAGLLGGAPVIDCPVQAFPVETRYLDGPRPGLRDLEATVAATVRRAHGETAGGILVFLPGEREIRRTEALLADGGPGLGLGPDTDVTPLYGALPPARQDAAIAPAPPGRRKVVLATSIAETSLTIEDVTVVVDGGFLRGPRFDPRTGLTRLETQRVTRAAADQRRGRAGQVAAGTCHRLWSAAEDRTLTPHRPAEILEADLAPLALDLAQWGVRDAADLAWLDPPPAAALGQARDLLTDLGALDAAGAITPHGRAMAGLALHPRLAHMVLRGRDLDLDLGGLGGLACDLAGLLSEGEILARPPGERTAELAPRLEALYGGGGPGVRGGVRSRARALGQRWRRQLDQGSEPGDPRQAGRLLALAYPDRVARRRPGGPARFVMANGRGAVLDDADPLAAEPFLAVAQVDGSAGDGRVFLAAPIARDELEDLFADRIRDEEQVTWNPRAEAVQASRRRLLGRLVLAETPLDPPPAEAVTAAVCDGIRRLGLDALPWTWDLIAWRHRVAFAAAHDPDGGWPDLSDGALLDGLDDWLGPYLAGVGRRAQFPRIDLAAALHARLPWDLARRLDTLAPARVTVPSGAERTVDYGETPPVLAVKLQEMFGQEETPRVAGGKVALALHLLSPAGRPLQVTRDLAGFWRTGYAAVRAEMRGRYPKHPWPENPLDAEPTARTKGRKRGD